MATYEELHSLHNNSALRNRVGVACMAAADTIMAEATEVPNHVNRMAWARRAYESPAAIVNPMFRAVISANRAATVEQITGANDAAIQANVDAAVDLFATGV